MSNLTEKEIVSKYGHETISLDSEDIEKLLQGKELYNTDYDEYSFSIVAEEPVPLISLDKVEKAREEMLAYIEPTTGQWTSGFNNGVNTCIEILDRLIAESEVK